MEVIVYISGPADNATYRAKLRRDNTMEGVNYPFSAYLGKNNVTNEYLITLPNGKRSFLKYFKHKIKT